MRTKIFEYKGYIGIQSAVDAEGLLNDPTKSGELGFVLDAAFVDIHPRALKLLMTIPKSGDDIGDFDVYKADDGRVILGWLGGPLKMFRPEEVSGSSVYSPELLKSDKTVECDPKFIKYIDSI